MAEVNRVAVLKLLGGLPTKPPWPSGRCIFRVPSTIRRHNEYVYDPQLVSIGPYHHGHERLQHMEKFKRWYLRCLLDRTPNPECNLSRLFEVIKSNAQYCLDCYSEMEEDTIIDIDKFIVMVILDGCFVIELFRKQAGVLPRHPDDPIFTTSYMRKILLSDLMLLENQLPWFVLEVLFDLTSSHQERGNTSIAGESSEMMDVRFDKGVMRIPPIVILDNAESLIRNLIAYEQCDGTCKDKITSYAVLLNNLIQSGTDLDYLREKGIVECFLSSKEIHVFFRSLYNDVDLVYYTYASMSRDIDRYCRSHLPRWRALLLTDYFSNPWSILSFIAALLLLLLSFLQTLFSIRFAC
ncbi:hypothetical protein SAY87_015278 [Trapa incisa]|uniref:Uncharacterized protein n=1 Tax=Trapa incisa TaxID=236973 RepID=A0AAN7H3L0_9MYRT|nr:hypothetical protein SAY87_015278 [Trapa incisa]